MSKKDDPTESKLPLLKDDSSLQLQASDLADANIIENKYYEIATASGMTILFFIGGGAGILYWAPSLSCAQSSCGSFLSSLVTEPVARLIYFISGFFGYGGSNAFFSAAALPRLIQYLSAQKTLASKILKGGALVVLTASQTASIFFIATGTGSTPMLIMLSVGGSIPGALFASINLMEKDFPYLFSKIRVIGNKILAPLSSVAATKKKYFVYYEDQQQQFIRKLTSRLISVIKNVDSLTFSDSEQSIKDPNKLLMLFLDKEPSEIKDLVISSSGNIPCVIKGLDLAVNLLAITFTLNFTCSIVNSSYDGLESDDSNSFSRWLLAILLNIANIYGNFSVTNGGIIILYKGIKKMLKGKSPLEDSLTFKLYPKASTVAAFSSLAIECCSYSVIDTLTTEMIVNRSISSQLQGIVRGAAVGGIIAYHSLAFFKLYSILLRKLTQNMQNKILFAMEEVVGLYKKMDVSSFANNIYNLAAETRKKWGISLYYKEATQIAQSMS